MTLVDSDGDAEADVLSDAELQTDGDADAAADPLPVSDDVALVDAHAVPLADVLNTGDCVSLPERERDGEADTDDNAEDDVELEIDGLLKVVVLEEPLGDKASLTVPEKLAVGDGEKEIGDDAVVEGSEDELLDNDAVVQLEPVIEMHIEGVGEGSRDAE